MSAWYPSREPPETRSCRQAVARRRSARPRRDADLAQGGSLWSEELEQRAIETVKNRHAKHVGVALTEGLRGDRHRRRHRGHGRGGRVAGAMMATSFYVRRLELHGE